MIPTRRRSRPSRTAALSHLHDHLLARVKGQPEVIERLTRSIWRLEHAAIPPRGCRGSFFFAGPTGVGKTETALAVAELACGPNRLMRFDCSELKTLDSVMALLGDRVRDRGRFGQAYGMVSEGVWLFDEIEKSHPEFVQLFLQMTEPGRVTLAGGEVLDLSGLYLIVTSNLGSAEILGREHLPFASLEKHVVRCIQRHLRPELLGRFGTPYVFRPLGRVAQAEVASLHLGRLLDWQRRQHGRRITVDQGVMPFLVQRGFSRRLGARPLLDTIHELVGDAIVANLQAGSGGHGVLRVEDQRLRLVPCD